MSWTDFQQVAAGGAVVDDLVERYSPGQRVCNGNGAVGRMAEKLSTFEPGFSPWPLLTLLVKNHLPMKDTKIADSRGLQVWWRVVRTARPTSMRPGHLEGLPPLRGVVCSRRPAWTDLLVAVADHARAGDREKNRDRAGSRAREVPRGPAPAGPGQRPKAELAEVVDQSMAELEMLAGGLVALRELTARTSDLVVSRGGSV